LGQKDLNERQHKWVSNIEAYNFDIEYVKGKDNIVADALLRIPSTYSMTEILVDWKSQLQVEYSKSKFACELMDGKIQDDRYRFMNDIIYYKGRIYLVPESSFKIKVLQAFHESPVAGH
jgi:hypothetical protein